MPVHDVPCGDVRSLDIPPLNSDTGVVIRVLLAESSSPGAEHYDLPAVRSGMYAMKATIVNRLRLGGGVFGAPGARTFAEIVGAPNQFAGFSLGSSGEVAIATEVAARVAAYVERAQHSPQGPYGVHLNTAREIAEAPPSDPFILLRTVAGIDVVGGTYGWRTVGAASPRGRFLAIPPENGGILSGNQFFTLRR